MKQNLDHCVDVSKDEIIDQLDLSLINPCFLDRAIQCWEEKNPLGILVLFSNEYGLDFVSKNIFPLLRDGIYEETLFHAYIGTRTNWSNYTNNDIKHFFGLGKRDRFLQAGDPLPHAGPFTLYRGIAGKGAKRHKRGISWTSSLEKAKWYSERLERYLELEKPMVFMAQVDAELVYAYTNGRNEEEFLCNIPNSLKLKKVWP